MTEHDPRRVALEPGPQATLASIRAALASSLTSPGSGRAAGAAAAFRSARAAARREQVPPAAIVEMILASWDELAESSGVPTNQRSERLAAVLSHAIVTLLDDAHEDAND